MLNAPLSGDRLTVTVGSAVTSGQFLLIGAMIGRAMVAAAANVPFTLAVGGVHSAAPKATGEAWTLGAAVFWDNTNSRFTTTASGNTRAGVAAAAALSADTTGSVRLNPSF